MFNKKIFILVCALLIMNDATAQSFQYDTQDRFVSYNTKYDPNNRLIESMGDTYHLPEIQANEYHFGGLIYNILTNKVKFIRTYNVQPYADIHQKPITLKNDIYYLKAREYMPNIKRFMQMDSWDINNRYLYAKGNPIMYMDPSGHISKILRWFIPTTTTEWFTLGIGMLLGGISDYFIVKKMISNKKITSLLTSSLFNGIVTAGMGYMGNGFGSHYWSDLRRVGTDFGIGFIEGLILGHSVYEKEIKVKTKKNKFILKREDELNTKKRFSSKDITHTGNIERYYAKGILETQMVIDNTNLRFTSPKKNVTSIGLNGLNPLTESKFKKTLSSDLSNSKYVPKYTPHSSLLSI